MRFIFLSIVLIALSTSVYGCEISADRGDSSNQSLPDEQSIQQHPQDILSLIHALDDKDESIRMQSAETLGDSPSMAGIPSPAGIPSLSVRFMLKRQLLP
ncbi:MAG: hypothetical protein QME49_05850 [bacterium]|nr:hypothetical protein [bacterium]